MSTTNDLTVGETILYPVQQSNGSVRDEARTISGIVEYPATRVLYFQEGGYGVSNRGVTHPTVQPR